MTSTTMLDVASPEKEQEVVAMDVDSDKGAKRQKTPDGTPSTVDERVDAADSHSPDQSADVMASSSASADAEAIDAADLATAVRVLETITNKQEPEAFQADERFKPLRRLIAKIATWNERLPNKKAIDLSQKKKNEKILKQQRREKQMAEDRKRTE